METISDLNQQLSIQCTEALQKARNELLMINSNYPSVFNSLKLVSSFEVAKFRQYVEQSLTEKMIPAWLSYQERDKVQQYDAIYFEYSDGDAPPYEAFSYGFYNMKNYKLTLSPHYYGYDYEFGTWEAGEGLVLEPFSICIPICTYNEETSAEYEKIHHEDDKSGVSELLDYANALCMSVLNTVFAAADAKGLFDEIRLKPGGIFMYDVHDGGSVQSPFYFKM